MCFVSVFACQRILSYISFSHIIEAYRRFEPFYLQLPAERFLVLSVLDFFYLFLCLLLDRQGSLISTKKWRRAKKGNWQHEA